VPLTTMFAVAWVPRYGQPEPALALAGEPSGEAGGD
jgi:hypothetical protein